MLVEDPARRLFRFHLRESVVNRYVVSFTQPTVSKALDHLSMHNFLLDSVSSHGTFPLLVNLLHLLKDFSVVKVGTVVNLLHFKSFGFIIITFIIALNCVCLVDSLLAHERPAFVLESGSVIGRSDHFLFLL